jgi:excisionase family DNA binding protein
VIAMSAASKPKLELVPKERPTPAPPMQKLAYTIPEAAQLSSLGQTSIYKAIRDGLLKAHKFGTRTVILHVDLMSFLDSLPIETKQAREL